MNIDLSGKNILVCGGSKGIGRACALEFAQLGANVTLLSRDEKALKKVVSQLQGDGHSYLVADLSDTKDIETKLSNHLSKNGPFHVLLNNCGGPPGGPITEADSEAFLMAFQNHLLANHKLAQLILPGMKKEGYGRIINIISTSVKTPLPGLGVSNTIRGAVANWAKTLANEVANEGITVNNVLPGATATDRLDSLLTAKATKAGHSLEVEKNLWLSKIPMKRFADPSEVANACVFLATPAASYITGISMAVDGGRTPCY